MITQNVRKSILRRGCRCDHCGKKSHDFEIPKNSELIEPDYSYKKHIELKCPICGGDMKYELTDSESSRNKGETKEILQKLTYMQAMGRKGISVSDIKLTFRLRYLPFWVKIIIIYAIVLTVVFVPIIIANK
jgi:hypothetical protein